MRFYDSMRHECAAVRSDRKVDILVLQRGDLANATLCDGADCSGLNQNRFRADLDERKTFLHAFRSRKRHSRAARNEAKRGERLTRRRWLRCCATLRCT